MDDSSNDDRAQKRDTPTDGESFVIGGLWAARAVMPGVTVEVIARTTGIDERAVREVISRATAGEGGEGGR